MRYRSLVLLLSCFLVCCANKPASQKQLSTSSQALNLKWRSGRPADDVARFLAGLPGRGGSPYRLLERGTAWTRHQEESDTLWAKAERMRLPALREFQRTELSGSPFDESTLFYPFGGPDSLTPLNLFPNSRRFVLVGLEPPGTVPRPEQFEGESLGDRLLSFDSSLSSLLLKSFFVTREMDRQLRGQVTDGVLEPVLAQVARSGRIIRGYAYVTLDEQGRLVDRPENLNRAAFGKNRGIAITFQAATGGPEQILCYLSVNLADRSLNKNTAFLRFVDQLERPVTFLKSTSYMMHQPGFSVIREKVLAVSRAVVQDDSGVPYRFFDLNGWQVQLYGAYTQPYGSFRYMRQPDLQAAYEQKDRAKPMKLRIGYGNFHIASNLQVARRKSARNTKS